MKKTVLRSIFTLSIAALWCTGTPSFAQTAEVAAPQATPKASVDTAVKKSAAEPAKSPSANKAAMAARLAKVEAQRKEHIRETLVRSLGPGTKIESVTKTPYGGLYEVRIGPELIYTDAKASFLFVGSVLDNKAATNFTKQRIDQITKVNFNELPLDLAVKYVKGDGKRVIAIFEDPNCGYCKKFRRTLQSVENVTIYTFMYNILADDSAQKSRDIWCSANRSKAWDEWMLEGKLPPAAPAGCQTPNDKVLALGQKFRVTGTPTVIFTDGSRLPGMVDVKALEDKWASMKSPAPAPAVAAR